MNFISLFNLFGQGRKFRVGFTGRLRKISQEAAFVNLQYSTTWCAVVVPRKDDWWAVIESVITAVVHIEIDPQPNRTVECRAMEMRMHNKFDGWGWWKLKLCSADCGEIVVESSVSRFAWVTPFLSLKLIHPEIIPPIWLMKQNYAYLNKLVYLPGICGISRSGKVIGDVLDQMNLICLSLFITVFITNRLKMDRKN